MSCEINCTVCGKVPNLHKTRRQAGQQASEFRPLGRYYFGWLFQRYMP